ncbi:hypothetical protein BJ944DRAFT_247763 [Cunninghamella echinulata]|nr:hypothetical protein BJ944DRAFT_247763 [Cunninghamella echinulata]
MEFNTAKPYSKSRYVHTNHQSLRKCCGCIHLRVGSAFASLIWAGISLYFAIICFQRQNPFFSYLPFQANIVFGVINLLFFIIALCGLFTLFLDYAHAVQVYSHTLWVFIALVLIDAFANLVVFGTDKSNYYDWCVNTAFQALPQDTQNGSQLNNGVDYYNCNKLWQDEFNFGLVCVFLMVTIYSYWATCVYSYSHKLAAIQLWESGMLTGQIEGIAPFFGGTMPLPQDRNVIVLQNEKPSSKTNKIKHGTDNDNDNGNSKKKSSWFLPTTLRSFKKKSKMTADVMPIDDSNTNNKGLSLPISMPQESSTLPNYPLDFKLGVNGNVIELS